VLDQIFVVEFRSYRGFLIKDKTCSKLIDRSKFVDYNILYQYQAAPVVFL